MQIRQKCRAKFVQFVLLTNPDLVYLAQILGKIFVQNDEKFHLTKVLAVWYTGILRAAVPGGQLRAAIIAHFYGGVNSKIAQN